MTVAVCVYCGSRKHGAFTHCTVCHRRPESELDIAYSLALTDHYFSAERLNEISSAMRGGQPRPSLPQQQEDKMREAAREYLRMYGNALGLPANLTDRAGTSNSLESRNSSAFVRALKKTKWPSAVGFLIGVSGAMGSKGGTLIGKAILALIVGSSVALAFGAITFAITYLVLVIRRVARS
jgi:hypothetical protein